MFRIPRRRPSAALIVACCSLFVALGGTSYALTTGSIGSIEIRDGSIRDVDVANRALRGEKIVLDGIGGNAVKEEALDASKLGTVARASAADHAASAGTASSAVHAGDATAADSAGTAAALQRQVVVTAAECGSTPAQATARRPIAASTCSCPADGHARTAPAAR